MTHIQEPVFCEFCGGNDENPPNHCMDCARPQEPDHGDELTIAYMSGVHRGKELAAQPAHVISEQDQLKNWIAMTNRLRAKQEYEPDAAQPAQEPEQGPVFNKLLAYVCNVPDDGIYAGELYQERHSLIDEAKAALAQPAQGPDYAYPTIEEYEEITGFKVNDTFRMGWAMARTTNDLFKQMEKHT